VVGLGMSYGAARSLSSQRYASTQGMAVLGMRGLLTSSTDLATLCTSGGTFNLTLNAVNANGQSATPSNVALTASAACTWAPVTVSVSGSAGLTATTGTNLPTALTLSTSAQDTGAVATLGGDGVLKFTQ
jgi:hypothetical protein